MNLYYKINTEPQELPEYIDVRTETINSVGDVDEHGIAEVDLTVTYETIASSNATEQQIESSGWILAPIKPEETDFVTVNWDGSNWVTEDSEAAKLRGEMWKAIRLARNELLSATDNLVKEYIEAGQETPIELINYRSYLRDIPQNFETGTIDDYVNAQVPESLLIYQANIVSGVTLAEYEELNNE